MMHNTGITADAAETAALAVDGPQPVWMTLNEARERAFTGEIVFETDPEVLAYLDHGIVYYAERVTDASLGQPSARRRRDRHRAARPRHRPRRRHRTSRPALRPGSHRSTATRWSWWPSAPPRNSSTELANRTVTTVRVTAYRHHPSGVHRWFVAPIDPAATVQRPVSAVAQLDPRSSTTCPGCRSPRPTSSPSNGTTRSTTR